MAVLRTLETRVTKSLIPDLHQFEGVVMDSEYVPQNHVLGFSAMGGITFGSVGYTFAHVLVLDDSTLLRMAFPSFEVGPQGLCEDLSSKIADKKCLEPSYYISGSFDPSQLMKHNGDNYALARHYTRHPKLTEEVKKRFQELRQTVISDFRQW